MIIQKKVLSVFSLAMINVIAVDSLRSLPISAEYGLSVIFFYLVATLVFFIPTALVAAELATGWPKTGGLYIWVREAFGTRWGFVTIWMQWVYNIVWYPTILSFIAGTFAYLMEPSLANSKVYLVSTIMACFWVTTLANCFGMRVSSFFSSVGAILGTIVPMTLIILLGCIWWYRGMPLQITLSWHHALPTVNSFTDLAFIAALLFGLLGMEMSAVHAEEVKNPQRDYPKALLYSTTIIFLSLTFASLAIALVVPHDALSLVTGLIDAYQIFFNAFHIPWMTPVMAGSIILGGLCGVSAWIIGPTKGLLAASRDGALPKQLTYTNRYGAPVVLLLIQGIIFTLLCLVFIFMPTINSGYWILSASTSQLAMIVYLFMFAAVVKLRYSKPKTERAFKIPGGRFGVWLVALAGFGSSFFAIVIGFYPPTGIEVQSLWGYEAFLVSSLLIFMLAPLVLYRKAGVAKMVE